MTRTQQQHSSSAHSAQPLPCIRISDGAMQRYHVRTSNGAVIGTVVAVAEWYSAYATERCGASRKLGTYRTLDTAQKAIERHSHGAGGVA